MRKWVTLQNHLVNQASCSKVFPLVIRRVLTRFAFEKVSDEEILGLLQEVQKELKSTEADNTNDENGSKLRGAESPLEHIPLSPLMHPNLISARRRYTESKPLPSKDKTEFQKLLEKNPFARILASPVRCCALTNIRLPKFFLDSFRLRTHPKTGAPWYDPIGLELTMKEIHAIEEDDEKEPNAYGGQDLISEPSQEQSEQSRPSSDHNFSQIDDSVPFKGTLQPFQDEGLPKQRVEQLFPTAEAALQFMPDRPIMQQHASIQRHKASSNPNEALTPNLQLSYLPFPSTSHMTSQMSVYHRLSRLSPRKLSYIIPRRWRDASASHPNFNLMKDVVWRADMDTFALDLIRKRVVRLLQAMELRRIVYLLPCSSYESIKEHHQVGAVLWVGQRNGNSPRNGEKASGAEESTDTETNAQEVEVEEIGVKEGNQAEDGEGKDIPIDSRLEERKPEQAESFDSLSMPPPSYATVSYKNHHVPLFNIHFLLGEAYIKSLRFYVGAGCQPLYVIKNKHKTVQVISWLWKLQAYLDKGVEENHVRQKAIAKARARICENVVKATTENKKQRKPQVLVSEERRTQPVSPKLLIRKVESKHVAVQEVSSPNVVTKDVHAISSPSSEAEDENAELVSSPEKDNFETASLQEESNIEAASSLEESEIESAPSPKNAPHTT